MDKAHMPLPAWMERHGFLFSTLIARVADRKVFKCPRNTFEMSLKHLKGHANSFKSLCEVCKRLVFCLFPSQGGCQFWGWGLEYLSLFGIVLAFMVIIFFDLFKFKDGTWPTWRGKRAGRTPLNVLRSLGPPGLPRFV